jgi:hypothetical protein
MPFPRAATIFLLISATLFLISPAFCHAQNEITTCAPPNYISVEPIDWEANFQTDIPVFAAPGQSYNFSI